MLYEGNPLHAFEFFLYFLPSFGAANDLILELVLETLGPK